MAIHVEILKGFHLTKRKKQTTSVRIIKHMQETMHDLLLHLPIIVQLHS